MHVSGIREALIELTGVCGKYSQTATNDKSEFARKQYKFITTNYTLYVK